VLKGDFPDPMDRLKGALRLLAPVADAARRAKEAA
jgi:transcription-repair coupling factor (superfamily II helicase)